MAHKHHHISLAVAGLCLTLVSCFKDEPQNAEADILKASVFVANPDKFFFNMSDTAQVIPYAESNITFNVKSQADLTNLAPRFVLTPGATISPASGSSHDFSHSPVNYTVTSEDGNWHRTYIVRFNPVKVTVNETVNCDFEHYELESREQKYYIWRNEKDDGTLGNDWATGNAGFRISMGSALPADYPTIPFTEGRHGAAVRLITRDTGALGTMVNKRIAAGNLFLGNFDLTQALTDAMKATRFGVPFDKRPVSFEGYYRYQPGKKFQDHDGQIIDGRTDQAAIYAVLYRNHDSDGNAIVLYGDNVKTSQQIVAIADMKDIIPADDWTSFKVTFDYRAEIDPSLLENRGYSLAVVFSSSAEGDKFEGSIGSTLDIDDVKINCTITE